MDPETRCAITMFTLVLFCGIAINKIRSSLPYKMYVEIGDCFDDFLWMSTFADLESDLAGSVHGQHLVIKTVAKSVKAHLQDPHPSKPLVLSFHGWTGGGKNFVSRIIMKNMYETGDKSRYAHVLNAEIHFTHPEKIDSYKDQLQNLIRGNVTLCRRSLFIFDEVDHMPEGMINVLTPFLGHNEHVDGVDFRKSIFIFLSNTGGNDITEAVLQRRKEGRVRESISLSEMQAILKLNAFNQKSGFEKKNLIDHFVPFLPLEKEHVRLCIHDELKRRNVRYCSDDDINEVLNELEWFPKDLNYFSTSGCKNIAHKVGLLD